MSGTWEYSQPTTVVGGSGVARRAGEYAGLFGSRALVVSGGFASTASGALDAVRDGLVSRVIPMVELEGVPANPGVAVVEAGVELARAQGIDVIVAVGGGSVLDVAKAISVGHGSGLPIRSQLSGLRSAPTFVDVVTPMVAVPILPGSGSEVNGTSVLIDEVTGRKLSMHADLAAPRIALLDPDYSVSAPQVVVAAALADALAHAIEAALSARASVASDASARAAMLMLRDYAAVAVSDRAEHPIRVEAMLRCMYAAGMASQALTMAGSIVTHPLSHPLSARLGLHHGAAVARLQAVVVMKLSGRWGGRAGMVARWLGEDVPVSAPPAEQAKKLASAITQFHGMLGVESSLEDLGLTNEMVDQLTEDVMASGSRGLANVPGRTLTAVDLASIYRAALSAPASIVPNVAPLL